MPTAAGRCSEMKYIDWQSVCHWKSVLCVDTCSARMRLQMYDLLTNIHSTAIPSICLFWHLFDTETDPCVGVFVWHTKCHWFLYWHVFHISVKILSMEKHKTNCYNLPVGRILKKYAPCHCQFVTSFVAWNLQLIRQTFTGAPGGKGSAPRWKQGEVKELACNGVPFKSAIPRWFSTMPEECLFNSMICWFSGGRHCQ